ncbi:MAG: hypothetical protein M3R15_06760, partial [Acidobacteriota bacterium]|nr:hypothetical protein [Acidobacteriota bacterium]
MLPKCNLFSRLTHYTFVIGLTLLFLPVQTAAWGKSGHRIVALIATKHLTPEARQGIRTLLGNEDLAAIALHADTIRPHRPETSRWHFVNLPRRAAGFVPARDCVQSGQGDCAVAAIER